MSEKKFFFEEDGVEAETAPAEQPKEDAGKLVEAMRKVGIVRDGTEQGPDNVAGDASMKTYSSKLLLIEYGTYQSNYAVHITPVHPRRNLSSQSQIERAVRSLAINLNECVGHSLQVHIHLPRDDWQVKVISFVVVDGAGAWNFQDKKFEEECIPVIAKEIEKICME